MANETKLTIQGNATSDPELRFTPNGVAVVNFTVASTPRFFDKQTNEFKDSETIFMRVTAWRDLAQNVAESVQRGTRVIVTGNLKPNSWEKDGVKHSTFELAADDVSVSLVRATAVVTKNPSAQGNRPPHPADQQQSSGWGSSFGDDHRRLLAEARGDGQQQAQQATPGTDPWGTDNRNPDEPPF
ncbi:MULTISPECIES: single-stranded DNA-binding protein [Brevibacterium]|uniref:Single-stranded DNA-binding protein n=1 Tax=Brevibacterium antiquum CNRZ 918 TaxID=1255637 RepID=A0A2H1KE82_9MICO|nr:MULTISPECIES: single-stranded DNA-binding protein [Brevibacterium]SMX97949.1 single-strand DNA-binding protein [Brevibacterium antiquum CNRZ 918]HCG55346.1 single-stranded DNA-binding protein [Brevibacterium sp.]